MFAIAATVYCMTVEPTASLWDCPEFIACGYKLQIGHPPGAPVFMLAANLFSQFASSPSQVSLMVNLLSALLSAGCIFFLFLTITHLARQLMERSMAAANWLSPSGRRTCDSSLFTLHFSLPQVIIIEACGVVGALAYTFSDTFWYSAVEAEVYAFSSFLTALMFWLILKWERECNESGSDRWLILIAYITGLSIGVHLLCLLCLPAMALVVYFRTSKQITRWGTLKAFAAGCFLVGIILYGLIPGVVKLGGWFELLFTNLMGCPYNTGLLCYIVVLTGGLIFLYYKTKRRFFKLSLACLLMILAGYSSYGVIFIRANAHTPMCENAPDNIFSLGSYLNREQYGYTPLLYGPAYSSELDREIQGDYLVPRQEEGKAIYRPSADSTKRHYDVVRHDIKYLHKENMLFPRMHSQRHAKAYEDWMGGVEKKDNLPTMAENLRFFFTYQVNFMYWRYFLWNFVGRQNNIQGHGEVEHGNWITGFRWIDDLLLSCDTSKLPSDLVHNKGRNVFYAMPLLLGLAGIFWQWRRKHEGRQQLLIVSLLFVMTGLTIVVYLNQTPLQPRERDYAYAGSFYAFAIWIGLGVAGVYKILRPTPCPSLQGRGVNTLKTGMQQTNYLLPSIQGGAGGWVCLGVGLLCLLVPLQMATQTWDDHDRSDRYTCRDFGANYLESMQPEGKPIILTNGDNDTFPLWYNHEVEGLRTDTRCCNMEYLQTDWYIDQMKRPAYHSPALPISWHHEDYQEGRREAIPVHPELKSEIMEYMAQQPEGAKQLLGDQPFELKNIIRNWVLSEDSSMQCIPTDSITITGDKGTMHISLSGKQTIYKNEMMVLEMLSHARWDRPIYASISMGPDQLSFLRDHMVLEGLAYRISPTATHKQVDTERLYHNVMHRFRFGGLNTRGIYVDEDVKHMANTHQVVMGILIDSLMQQGDTKRALEVCRKWQHEMPVENVPYTDAALSMARCFYQTQRAKEGDKIVSHLLRRSDEWLSWIETIAPSRRSGSLYSQYSWIQTMQQALSIAVQYNRTKIYLQYSKQYEHHLQQYPQA